MQTQTNIAKITTDVMARLKTTTPVSALAAVALKPQEDALHQLKSNVQELTDLHSRLSFMMREVNYLLKRS